MTEETNQLGKDVEVFQNANEGKEQGDFGDYGWGNIGSFDDLDQIFRLCKFVYFCIYGICIVFIAHNHKFL